MVDGKSYIAIVQCDLVMQRCSGYLCEKSFHERTGGFSAYPADRDYRTLYMTCGGCCGRGLQRKLSNLLRKLAEKEGLGAEAVVVQLASCITKDNYHGPPCPHLDYLRALIAKVGVDVRDDTSISKTAEARRAAGLYRS